MKLGLKLLLKSQGRRYVFIGGFVYLLEIAVIIIAQHLGAGAFVAVGISFWVGLIVSFILNKLITFEDNRLHHRVLLPQVIAFSLLVLFNFCFTLAVTSILSRFLPATIIRTLALLVTTIWNFYLYKTRIFRSDNNPVY